MVGSKQDMKRQQMCRNFARTSSDRRLGCRPHDVDAHAGLVERATYQQAGMAGVIHTNGLLATTTKPGKQVRVNLVCLGTGGIPAVNLSHKEGKKSNYGNLLLKAETASGLGGSTRAI